MARSKSACASSNRAITSGAEAILGERAEGGVRSIRFPGLISAETLPTSGTTDYAPAMIHAAVEGKPYDCFVNEATQLPFMTMTDGVGHLHDPGKRARYRLG